MQMQTVVWLALIASAAVCVAIAFKHSRAVHWVSDVLPMQFGHAAKVAHHKEFSASTVAASISLATVVVAFYELAPFLGIWLLWPAITTALGLGVFGLVAKRVWQKMNRYDARPTLHAYLGEEYKSNNLALVASLFTAAGYLTAFAVELTVGARFLSPLLPGAPIAILVLLLALVSFGYTALGGFRTVVVTDRLQMAFIWALIGALSIFYFEQISGSGVEAAMHRIPGQLVNISWSEDKVPFVLGILVMNLLTYLGNMSLWQRIAGAQSVETVSNGLVGSVWSALLSWSLLAMAAVVALAITSPVTGENLLITIVKMMIEAKWGAALVFVVVMGLLGAMLSTASTQLMAVTHTVYEDIIAPFRRSDFSARMVERSEVSYSRIILAVSAVASVCIVELLRALGFSVADMAFAMYGAALGLVPPILVTLFVSPKRTQALGSYAMFAIGGGFAACWMAAGYGRLHGNGNLVFLSPVISASFAAIVMAVGLLARGPSLAAPAE